MCADSLVHCMNVNDQIFIILHMLTLAYSRQTTIRLTDNYKQRTGTKQGI